MERKSAQTFLKIWRQVEYWTGQRDHLEDRVWMPTEATIWRQAAAKRAAAVAAVVTAAVAEGL
jgi:hypothetical protein